jgi:tetratricopeptide (TPR) repeat protein
VKARPRKAWLVLAGLLAGALANPGPAAGQAAPSKTAPSPAQPAPRAAPAASAPAPAQSPPGGGAAPAATPGKATAPAASRAPAVSVPSACPSAPSAGPTAGVPAVKPLKLKKGAAPAPPPSKQQLRAFQTLQEEAKHYEEGAKDFRRTLTMIVRHHFEERRRRVLSALDHEIGIERKELASARDDAIKRLEAFIARYSGANAHPEATPDAMFRLAALYEERARGMNDADLPRALEPAMALYRRLIFEFPKYKENAAVHYFLGHAFTDAGRLEEGQQAWRALACANKYAVRTDPKDPRKIELIPLPQDHPEKFWTEWYNRNQVPLDQLKGAARPAKPAKPPKRGAKPPPGVAAEELSFIDPYGECKPVPQQTDPGEEPRYLAEIWWQIGNFHFDQIDPKGGPYNLNRAVSAYQHAMEHKKPPLYGVSMYKLAWTDFKQQRYRTAVQEFVKLLHYADEQEEKTGDPGADFRSEAFTYIAGSLTYVDFDGPPAEHPFIPRADVLDTEPNPLLAEKKMSIAIERVQDPKLIPQDKKWSVEVYKSLAQEFIEITQNRNAIATLELTLSKFAMDRDGPVMQNKVAELYDQLARLAPDGSAAKTEYAAKALEARTKLAAYVGTTPWTDANKDDPEALAQAEQLVRGGLKRAAADHTNYARNYYTKALELSDPGEQKSLIEKAIEEYRLAATGWNAYLAQDATALDAYESKFWLADARYWVVVLQVAIAKTPRQDEVQEARDAAVAVRESNEDDKYLQPAAYYVVTIAEKVLEDQYRLFEDSHGSRGIERRTELKFSGEGDKRKVIKDSPPCEVLAAIQARDEYNARIPVDRDPQKNGLLYAFQSAELYFVYGQFDLARQRYKPLYDQYCGKNEWGYKAWEKLISMSNFEGNAKESRRLAEGRKCSYNAETEKAEEAIRKPVKQGVAYLDARTLYEEAEKMKDGPERSKKWREAAAQYKVALDAAPDRDEAPEAAMNGAYAYKQVGEYDKAIEMYELFISRYGDERTLQKLRAGDPKATPPVAPQPKKYEERVKFLKSAYDALAGAYVLFFNYPKSAETFDKISRIDHFPQNQRREASRQALSLYSSIGDRAGMNRALERFRTQGGSPKELAEADFIVASAELKKWDPLSPDSGANGDARRAALRAMESYYNDNKNKPAAAQYVVQAAYWTAKAKKAGAAQDANAWWQKTIASFDTWRRLAPADKGKSTALGSREAGMAAEAEFTMIDEDLVKNFDYDAGHHHYKGTPVEVVRQYQKDAVEAKRHYDKLQRVMDAYVSPEWTTAAVARQGSLYDSLRTGLYNARPPALKMFDAKTEALLKKAEGSDNPDLQEKADAVRTSVQKAWRDRRDQELNSADQVAIDRYATAVVLARRYNVSKPAVTHALRRLAFFTDVIGEAKMRQFTAGVKDLNYTEGMFLRMRPGMVKAPDPQGMPQPLPVWVQ